MLPCQNLGSAILDLATVFSAAAVNFRRAPSGRAMALTHHAEDESSNAMRPSEQRAQSAHLRGFFERNLQMGDDLGGHTLNRFPDRLSPSGREPLDPRR